MTPVGGIVRVQHHRNYLEVFGKAETIITCTCNRCLQTYNHRLMINTSEIIWLQEVVQEEIYLHIEKEVTVDDLVDSLSPEGYFEPGVWLYEQISLEVPQQQLCYANCAGIHTVINDSNNLVDSRWASLESLKNQFPT